MLSSTSLTCHYLSNVKRLQVPLRHGIEHVLPCAAWQRCVEPTARRGHSCRVHPSDPRRQLRPTIFSREWTHTVPLELLCSTLSLSRSPLHVLYFILSPLSTACSTVPHSHLSDFFSSLLHTFSTWATTSKCFLLKIMLDCVAFANDCVRVSDPPGT